MTFVYMLHNAALDYAQSSISSSAYRKTATPNTTNRIEITANEIAIITSGLKKHMISFLPL